jgi:hypothetical protein
MIVSSRSCFGQPEVPDLARLEQEASLWAAPLDGPFERAEREMPVIHRTQGPADDEPLLSRDRAANCAVIALSLRLLFHASRFQW